LRDGRPAPAINGGAALRPQLSRRPSPWPGHASSCHPARGQAAGRLTATLLARPPTTPDPADTTASWKAAHTFLALYRAPDPGVAARLHSPELGARLAAALRAVACPRPVLRQAAAGVAERIDAKLNGAAVGGVPPAADAGGGAGAGGASPAGGSRGEPGARPGAAPSAAEAAAGHAPGVTGIVLSFDRCANCGRRGARLLPCSACHLARCARPPPSRRGRRPHGRPAALVVTTHRARHTPRPAAVGLSIAPPPRPHPQRYCSKDCQRANWPAHKAVCSVLVSSRRTAATGRV
jgi:hypothetical protein